MAHDVTAALAEVDRRLAELRDQSQKTGWSITYLELIRKILVDYKHAGPMEIEDRQVIDRCIADLVKSNDLP